MARYELGERAVVVIAPAAEAKVVGILDSNEVVEPDMAPVEQGRGRAIAAATALIAIVMVAVVFFLSRTAADDGTESDQSETTATGVSESTAVELTAVASSTVTSAGGDAVADESSDPSSPGSSQGDDVEAVPTLVEPNDDLEEPAASSLTGTGVGSAELVLQSGDALIDAPMTLTVTDSDFVLEASTAECTNVAWTLDGPSTRREYNSEGECFDEHVMSPRTDVLLQSNASYEVVVTLSTGSSTETLVFTVMTAP